MDNKLQAYRKALQSENDELEKKYGGGGSSSVGTVGGNQSNQSSKSKRRGKHQQSNQSPQSSAWASDEKNESSVSSDKKCSATKPKYVPLYSDEGQEKLVMKLPGSRPCDCQASKHRLINNCLKCGRIVCDQEGSGPCFFCGSLVCTPEEQDTLNAGGKKAEDLKRRLRAVTSERLLKSPPQQQQQINNATMTGGQHQILDTMFDSVQQNKPAVGISLSAIGDDLKRAVAEKDRLIEFQQNSAMRTKVYDDESDYYSLVESNPWLSKEDRERARKKHDEFTQMRNSAKRNLNFTLDLAGRRVIEDENKPMINMHGDEYMRQLLYSADGGGGMTSSLTNQDSANYSTDLDYVNTTTAANMSQFDDNPYKSTNRTMAAGQAIWSDENYQNDPSSSDSHNRISLSRPVERSRIQDLGYNELCDMGVCLSMHQPFASLLVRGIKKFEGRSWYISHRGILWIASTAKQVPRSDIQEIETFYRHLYTDELPAPFPENYPIGCLLGCVQVVDCLSQEQYRALYPAGESESPYVAICIDARELPVKFPIMGQHKLYKLDPKIHAAAKIAIYAGPPLGRPFMGQ